MNHSFDIDHAREYGVNEAIMIQNLQFWIEKNRANGRHLYDERTWTYNSVKAFSDLFPYMSAGVVRRTLSNLQERGVILSGNYNASQYDRTAWFAFADESVWLPNPAHLSKTTNAFVKNDKCIVQKQQMDLSKTTNPFVKNDNSDTDIKPVVTAYEASAPPAALPTEPPAPPDKPAKPKADDETALLQEACRLTWGAYVTAYQTRYGAEPVRNAKVNASIKAFVRRVGEDEAPAVAEFYVARVDDQMVMRSMHDTGFLLKSAEAYRTQWATGRTVDASDHRATTTPKAMPMSFAERDRIQGMQRWEENCNMRHADLPPGYSKFDKNVNVIDTTPSQVRIAK